MNLAMIPQTALATKLRRADNHPLACVLTLHGTSCIWKVLHFSNCDLQSTHSYREEPRPQGHWLSLCSLGAAAFGPQEEPKRGRTPELCEEVVSTYIPNCQLFVYSEVVSTYIQNWKFLFVYSQVVSTYIQSCQLFVYVGPPKKFTRPPCCFLHPLTHLQGWYMRSAGKSVCLKFYYADFAIFLT